MVLEGMQIMNIQDMSIELHKKRKHPNDVKRHLQAMKIDYGFVEPAKPRQKDFTSNCLLNICEPNCPNYMQQWIVMNTVYIFSDGSLCEQLAFNLHFTC